MKCFHWIQLVFEGEVVGNHASGNLVEGLEAVGC